MTEVKYVALRRMRLPNPGQSPSSLRLERGDVFSLDGSEGLDIGNLLRCGVIQLQEKALPQDEDTPISGVPPRISIPPRRGRERGA